MKKRDFSPFDLALNYLSYRSRTEKEMCDYLQKKGFDFAVIEDVIEKLKAYHYIDDEKFIQTAVNQNCLGNQFGRQRLKTDLLRHGIKESDLIIFNQYYTEEMEAACLRTQFKKICTRYKSEPVLKQKQKIIACLQRRGFSYGMILALISAHHFCFEEEGSDSDAKMPRLNQYYEKYEQMYRGKGYTDRELTSRIIRGLLSRGFTYDAVKDVMSMHAAEENEDEKC